MLTKKDTRDIIKPASWLKYASVDHCIS